MTEHIFHGEDLVHFNLLERCLLIVYLAPSDKLTTVRSEGTRKASIIQFGYIHRGVTRLPPVWSLAARVGSHTRPCEAGILTY